VTTAGDATAHVETLRGADAQVHPLFPRFVGLPPPNAFETALGAGGRPFLPSFVKGLPPRWKGSVSRNITSHPEQGLGGWSDAEIKRAITQGIGRDGRRMQEPMAFAWYAGMRDEDLDALVAYLRSVPPIAR
jgi:hypothetical protein